MTEYQYITLREKTEIKERRIEKIMIFYTDNTYEVFQK